MQSIENIREEINRIDKEITKLYEKRLDLMGDVAEYKYQNDLPVLDLEREKKVIDNNSNYIKNAKYKPLYIELIQLIMDQGKSLQEEYIKLKNE